MKLLSGRILKPSHSSSFVDTLLSCQPDSPVSRLVLLEDETQQKIQDIYTHISPKESPYASQITLFSKTSKESSAAKQPMENRYSNMSSETWKKEVTVQRGEYSARLKQVRHINEKESLSWPTANEEKKWATPQAMDGRSDVRKPEERSDKAKKGGCSNLREQVHNWATPTSTERSGTNPKTGKGGGLSKQAKEQSWPTPEVHTVEKYSLQKDGQKKTQRSKNLVAMAIKGELGLPDQEKSSTSGKSQESPGKLNPNWVEQLMGLPLGWTQLPIEWTD